MGFRPDNGLDLQSKSNRRGREEKKRPIDGSYSLE